MKIGLRELAFVALMIGLAVASVFYVFKPSAEKRASRERDIEARQKALTNLRSATSDIGDLARKIEDLESAISFFESKLPQQKDLDKIVREVWQKAEKHNLQTRVIKTRKTERAAGYSELPIELGLSGPFNGFYAFLLDLEKLPRITQMNQMKLDKITSRDGDMQANMTLSVFFESGAN
jgi:type IV pilus assembly protein PilO